MASIVNQDGKNKGMHMMGQTVLLELDRGDEVYVYTFTGSWTADWPHIHFTQFVGINSNNHHFHQTETETDRNSTTTRSSHQAWKLTSSNGVRVDVDEVTQERASWLKYAYMHSVIHIVYSILFLNTLFLQPFFFLTPDLQWRFEWNISFSELLYLFLKLNIRLSLCLTLLCLFAVLLDLLLCWFI